MNPEEDQIEELVLSLFAKEYLTLTEEENTQLSDQQFGYIKSELIAHVVFLINQRLEVIPEDYRDIVMSVLERFDEKYHTDIAVGMERVLWTRYSDFLNITEVEKRYE